MLLPAYAFGFIRRGHSHLVTLLVAFIGLTTHEMA